MIQWILLCLSTTYAIRFARIGPSFNRLSREESLEMSRICGTSTIPLSNEFPLPSNNLLDHLIPRSLYPWAVSISIDGKNRLGGALISPYHVLTAAHGFLIYTSYYTKCSSRGYKDIQEVRMKDVSYGGLCIRGIHPILPNHPKCLQPDVIRNKIRSVMVDYHFGEGHCIKGHDWAIIELEQRVNFTDRVRPICLPYKGMRIQDRLTVPGWGRTYIFNEASPYLHAATMIHAPDCPRPISDGFPAHAPDMLCAVSQNTTDYWAPRTCHGDSGSGMQQIDENGRARLVALTSFGTQGCPANELARFTKIENYLDEICEETGVCYTLPLQNIPPNITNNISRRYRL